MILEDEQLDDLQLNNLFLIQKRNGFKFGVDAVLLSDFAKNTRSKRTLDLCTGTGVVPILMSAKTNTPEFHAVEIQPQIADMAKRSVEYNSLGGRIKIVCGDLKNAVNIYGKASFDKITCNPPYMKKASAIVNDNDTLSVSRHEILCTLEDVIKTSAQLLIPKGRLYMVHRPSRLVDIICLMREYRIEPKCIRMVAPNPKKEPNLLLIEGMYCGGKELRFMNQLCIFDENGNYSDEINKIYGRS